VPVWQPPWRPRARRSSPGALGLGQFRVVVLVATKQASREHGVHLPRWAVVRQASTTAIWPHARQLQQQRRCTANSVVAHTLYENADPFRLHEPAGMLDTSAASRNGRGACVSVLRQSRRRTRRPARAVPHRVRRRRPTGAGDCLTRMPELWELAKLVRAKNAGPFTLTFDIVLGDAQRMRRSSAAASSRANSLRGSIAWPPTMFCSSSTIVRLPSRRLFPTGVLRRSPGRGLFPRPAARPARRPVHPAPEPDADLGGRSRAHLAGKLAWRLRSKTCVRRLTTGLPIRVCW
jgi:uncharacterized protein DUF4387